MASIQHSNNVPLWNNPGSKGPPAWRTLHMQRLARGEPRYHMEIEKGEKWGKAVERMAHDFYGVPFGSRWLHHSGSAWTATTPANQRFKFHILGEAVPVSS